jgi:hypothetical protein
MPWEKKAFSWFFSAYPLLWMSLTHTHPLMQHHANDDTDIIHCLRLCMRIVPKALLPLYCLHISTVLLTSAKALLHVMVVRL